MSFLSCSSPTGPIGDPGSVHTIRIKVVCGKDDGRWDAAYAGQATIEVLADLTAALDLEPRAKAMFDASAVTRYAVLYRIYEAKRADTRVRRIERFVAMLARGETIPPQGKAK
jgi:uncharacterized protein YdeI (YjbR/CyaY-like superfamily)